MTSAWSKLRDQFRRRVLETRSRGEANEKKARKRGKIRPGRNKRGENGQTRFSLCRVFSSELTLPSAVGSYRGISHPPPCHSRTIATPISSSSSSSNSGVYPATSFRNVHSVGPRLKLLVAGGTALAPARGERAVSQPVALRGDVRLMHGHVHHDAHRHMLGPVKRIA